MDVRRRGGSTAERFVGTGVDMDVFTVDGLQDGKGVVRGSFQRRVAVCCAYP
jgi:hypothetical protein